MKEIENGSKAGNEAEGELENTISELEEKNFNVSNQIFGASIKLDTARTILIKLTEDYGFSEELAPTYKGIYDWIRKSGEKTPQERNSMTWVEDYEFIQTMLYVLLDCVHESRKALMACSES